MDAEWDEAKRLRNLRDHGVDFEDAVLIFRNPIIEARDARRKYGETRFRALGQTGGNYYIVVYTWRGTVCRIISAWKVGEDGKKRYQAIFARSP